ncbi:molybdopterin-dependent oxidoreductase [Vibrio astriarenae]
MMVRLLAVWLIFASLYLQADTLTLHPKTGRTLTLSLQQIEQSLPMHSFSTKLPWHDEELDFSGFRLDELIEHFEIAPPTHVTISALNDYRADIHWSEITHFNPIVAYRLNGEEIKIRDKGPYWLVFDVQRYPALDDHTYYEKMVWQISDILFHYQSSK